MTMLTTAVTSYGKKSEWKQEEGKTTTEKNFILSQRNNCFSRGFWRTAWGWKYAKYGNPSSYFAYIFLFSFLSRKNTFWNSIKWWTNYNSKSCFDFLERGKRRVNYGRLFHPFSYFLFSSSRIFTSTHRRRFTTQMLRKDENEMRWEYKIKRSKKKLFHSFLRILCFFCCYHLVVV